jgi:hypothetical protein
MKWAFMRYIRYFRKSGCIGARLECETHNKTAAQFSAGSTLTHRYPETHPERLVRRYIASALSSGRYNSARDAFPATREFHDPSRGSDHSK